MHRLELPAGSTLQLNASTLPGGGVHRWDIWVFPAEGAPAGVPLPPPNYGSRIGGLDCEQRLNIPAFTADRRLQVRSRQSVGDGWVEDACAVDEDTLSRLMLRFAGAASPGAAGHDVSLGFTFEAAPVPAAGA